MVAFDREKYILGHNVQRRGACSRSWNFFFLVKVGILLMSTFYNDSYNNIMKNWLFFGKPWRHSTEIPPFGLRAHSPILSHNGQYFILRYIIILVGCRRFFFLFFQFCPSRIDHNNIIIVAILSFLNLYYTYISLVVTLAAVSPNSLQTYIRTTTNSSFE